ncbi:MAG: hypothetical protein QXE05_00080 [Nitrososphaeria archaeon]
MNEDAELQTYLSLYQAFIVIISLFIGFILTTIAIVSFSEKSIELYRFIFWGLLASFLLMEFILIRTQNNTLKLISKKGINIPCPAYNDELFCIGMLALASSLCLMIARLYLFEAIIFEVLSVILTIWALLSIKNAKKAKKKQSGS